MMTKNLIIEKNNPNSFDLYWVLIFIKIAVLSLSNFMHYYTKLSFLAEASKTRWF